jgi:hypothetical protein
LSPCCLITATTLVRVTVAAATARVVGIAVVTAASIATTITAIGIASIVAITVTVGVIIKNHGCSWLGVVR